jgi:hypothetical protein
MPDPISNSNQCSSANACIDDDGDASAANTSAANTSGTQAPANANANQSLSAPATEPSACLAQPDAVKTLVGKFTPPAPPPKATPGAPPLLTLSGPSTSSGPVPGGSYRVGANLVTGQLTLGPLQSKVEVGTVAVQSGTDKDAEIALARRNTVLNVGGGYSLTVADELGSARANLGEHNDDGSIGGNIGSGATLAGTEATIDTPYGSVTYGQSLALSLGGSMGVRDADHDGKPEFCAKFSVPAYTVGACVEQFW